MIGRPAPAKGATDISAAPATAAPSALQPRPSSRGALFRLQNTPPKATNQASTERSTCTTSATWKKSTSGNQSLVSGARESTSSTENTPERASATSASQSQPSASRRRGPSGNGNA